jgi:predicted DCC family thiol-disulfide oxidoreductase YuxK
MSTQTLAAADRLPAAGTLTSASANLVLYDGVCGLCNRLVRFLLRIDRGAVLCFAPLQGPTAARLAQKHGFPLDVKTLVYVRHFGLKQERVYLRSDGVLRIFGDVGGVWWPLSGLRIVPRLLRDPLYDWVATHRYRWFGKYDSCPMPSPQQRARFLP